jgi:ubiquinone/menaquinone biosynthesis C-methylase UbiE
MKKKINLWDERFKEKKYFLKWPDEMVVRFLAKNNGKRNQKVLDLGCGSGRHCELLIKQGYQVYGCDVSANAIKMTIERIRKLNLKGKFEVSYFNSLPYENEFFDMIIAWHSIYYNNFETLLGTINEISRVLKKNGLFLFSMISTGDFRETYGKTTDGITYVGRKNAYDHFGLTYCVINNENELKKLMKNRFQILSIGYHEMYFEKKQRNCHWIVTAQKS